MSEAIKATDTLSERIRKRLLKHLGTKPCPTCGHAPRGTAARLAEIAKEIGVGPSTLDKFAKGKLTRSDTLDGISTWLDDQVEKDGKR